MIYKLSFCCSSREFNICFVNSIILHIKPDTTVNSQPLQLNINNIFFKKKIIYKVIQNGQFQLPVCLQPCTLPLSLGTDNAYIVMVVATMKITLVMSNQGMQAFFALS